MPKFQVLKTSIRGSEPGKSPVWSARVVKGMFTDDLGEMNTYETMMFGNRGEAPPDFAVGEVFTPIIALGVNRKTGLPEFTIFALQKTSDKPQLKSA